MHSGIKRDLLHTDTEFVVTHDFFLKELRPNYILGNTMKIWLISYTVVVYFTFQKYAE